MRSITISTLLSVVLFVTADKLGIECVQNGFARAGYSFLIISAILKLIFLALLIVFLCKGVCHLVEFLGYRILLMAACIPVFMVSCVTTLFSERIILNLSRPINPDTFAKNESAVQRLSKLANEMIQQEKVFWVGNDMDHFVFSIKYDDGDYQFDSKHMADNYDFNSPLAAEDMSKVHHPDLPFISNKLKPTNAKPVSRSDYIFCKEASDVIRKIGFDNIKLYPEANVVQYQIYDFLGWDNGGYVVYYYCPDPNLPKEVEYSKKLNNNWYYIWEPRFKR